MTTQTINTQLNLVKDLRTIRDQISNEIKDMTFEQERAYLDKLLIDKEKYAPNKSIANSGAGRWSNRRNIAISFGSGRRNSFKHQNKLLIFE